MVKHQLSDSASCVALAVAVVLIATYEQATAGTSVPTISGVIGGVTAVLLVVATATQGPKTALRWLSVRIGAMYVLQYLPYTLVYRVMQAEVPHDRPGTNAWSWIAALLAYDFEYYWGHRLSHGHVFAFAGHVSTHHATPGTSLAAGGHIAPLDVLLQALWHVPSAISGIPPHQHLLIALASVFYRFMLHTPSSSYLGSLVFFNTSEHHCAHHRLLHRNYAGILMWDRLFGTYVQPDATAVD